jgi:cardiolipin synthase
LGLAHALLALAGCRIAAVPYTPEGPGLATPRGLVLARQVAADTAVELVNRAGPCAWENLQEMKEHVAAFAQGVAGKRVVLNCLAAPAPLPCNCTAMDSACLEAGLHQLTGCDLKPAHVDLYPDGSAALEALNQVIDQATRQIDVLMFYWENDALGAAVAARLAAKAGAGVRVRVLVDGGGNLTFCKPEYAPDGDLNRIVTELARCPQVELLRIRNPFGRFDHRKLVLVDSRTAWTGGRNFSASAFFKHHDLSFTLTGPLVRDLQNRFDEFWKAQGGQVEDRGSRNPPPNLALVENRESTIEEDGSQGTKSDPHSLNPRTAPSLAAHCSIVDPPWSVNAYARLLSAGPGTHELAHALYQAIDQACHHVYVENVYFSDSPLVCRLARARRRGVDVRAVVTFSTSSGAINRANRVVANRLLRAGVRVYVYPIMTHVKAAAVDGCWAYLGTGNFDPLSLRHNRELGFAVGGGPLLAEVEERLFLEDFRPEWELKEPLALTPEDYACELLASLVL